MIANKNHDDKGFGRLLQNDLALYQFDVKIKTS